MKCANPECNNDVRKTRGHRYCCDACRARANYLRYKSTRPKQVRATSNGISQKQINANIDRIVERAIANGTCYMSATLAPAVTG